MTPEKDRRPRTYIYDWLRGLASLAVICGHYKPFGLPKAPFIWSVHFFVLVTMALISVHPLTAGKLARRLCYAAFVYAVLLAVFHPLFVLTGRGYPEGLLPLLFHPYSTLIENPYFGNVWYLGLYVQILVFLLLFQTALRTFPAHAALLVSLVISQAFYVTVKVLFDAYTTFFLPGWLFIMALGWYVFPPLCAKLEGMRRHRAARLFASGAVFASAFAFTDAESWLGVSRNRTFILNSAACVAACHFFIELYYWLEERGLGARLRGGVFILSKYTLVLYVFHQGLQRILEPLNLDTALLTVIAVALGVPAGRAIHQAYLAIERIAGSLRKEGSRDDRKGIRTHGR